MGKIKSKTNKRHKTKKMVGCSKKTRKNYLGGSVDVPLAYTGQPFFSVPNPHLAYTGKGGSSCGLSTNTNIPINTNAVNPSLPNTGPVSDGNNTIFNSSLGQSGGCCGSCSTQTMIGGSNHREGCRCSSCKGMKGGNAGIPYPNGLVGTSWSPNVSSWPGVNGVPGDSNYYPVNTYNNDVSRQMVDLGANPPFLNMKGGKKRKQKGGTLSNFLAQDLINLGRQFQFGVGSAYNALAGYTAPVNPLPWKDQMVQSKMPINLATIK
jgi:hypothetical protein